MMMSNRMYNCKNPYQGPMLKVLCVCSAGLLRSPTVAWVLSNKPYNCNTRAVGMDTGHALIPIDEVLMNWADKVVCVEPDVYEGVKAYYPDLIDKCVVLDIPDMYGTREPKLVKIVKAQLKKLEKEFIKHDTEV